MTSVTGILLAIVVGLACLAMDSAFKQQSKVKLHWLVALLMGLPLAYVPVDCILLAEGYGTQAYVELAFAGMFVMVAALFILRTRKHHGTLKAVGLAIFSTFVFVAMLICRPTELQLSIDVPEQVHQGQAVTVTAQPPLTHDRIIQIFVKAHDDNKWWPSCDKAQPDRSSSAWKSTCRFGSEGYPAKESEKFSIGAFYDTFEESSSMPDSVWKLLKTQRTVSVTFSTSR